MIEVPICWTVEHISITREYSRQTHTSSLSVLSFTSSLLMCYAYFISMYIYKDDMYSLGSRPSLRAFTLRADYVWEENIEM